MERKLKDLSATLDQERSQYSEQRDQVKPAGDIKVGFADTRPGSHIICKSSFAFVGMFNGIGFTKSDNGKDE